MIRNIVFDIGNVLIGFEWGDYVLSLFDKETADKVSSAMFRGGHWVELDRAVIPVDGILELFISEEPDYKEQIIEAFERVGECVAKLDWVVPYLKSLKDRGYNLYFLSNMSEHVMNSNKDAFAFTEVMDGGVYSCHVNIVKPDKDIYTILLNKYDLVPEECVFIDDRKENTDVAEILGMKGLVFTSEEQMKRDIDKTIQGSMTLN